MDDSERDLFEGEGSRTMGELESTRLVTQQGRLVIVISLGLC